METVDTATLVGVEGHEIQVSSVRTDDGPSEKTLVVFPGYRYSSEAPALFYLRLAFSKYRWDIVSFDYRYNEIPGFRDLEHARVDAWIRDEARLIGDFIVSELHTKTICFLGKSLGTTVMHHVVHQAPISSHFDRVSYLILTPTQFQRDLVSHVSDSGNNGLFAIGTKDSFFDADLIQSTDAKDNIQWEIIRGGGHIFEDPARDLARSIDNVRNLTNTVERKIVDGWFG